MSTAVPNIFVSDSGAISLHRSQSILDLPMWPRGKFILLRNLCFFAKEYCSSGIKMTEYVKITEGVK